jgi:hypothetical protein
VSSLSRSNSALAQEHGKEAPLLLSCSTAKLKKKNDSVVYVQSVGPPTPGEWKTALAVV